MSGFVKALIEGAMAFTALYIVGKIAYEAGKDVAREEDDYARRVEEDGAQAEDDGDYICEEDPQRDGNEASDDAPQEPDKAQKIDEDKPTHRGQLKRRFSKVALALGIKKLARKNDSVVSELMRNPEKHKIEAYVEGGGLRINIRRRQTHTKEAGA